MLIFTDSGMSVSFQSGSAGSAGTVSQESSPQQQVAQQHGTVRTNIHPGSLQQVASSHSRDVLQSQNRNSRKQKTPNQSTHL